MAASADSRRLRSLLRPAPLLAVLAVAGLVAFYPNPLLAAGLVLLAILVAVFAAAPRAVVLLFLLLRASLDAAKESVSLYVSETVQITPAFFLTMLVILLGLGYILVHRLHFLEMPLVPWLMLFGFVALAQMPLCREPVPGLMEWMRFFSAFLVYVLVLDLFRDEASVLLLVRVVLWSGLIPVLVGLYQVAGDAGQYITGFVRANGTFTHPNPYAFYLIIILALLLNLFPAAPALGLRRRGLLLGAAVPVAAGIFFTYTRTAWIGIFILVLLVVVFRQRKFLWLLLIPVLVLLLVSPLRERLQDLGTSFNSITHRFHIWTSGLKNLPDYPLLGRGLGSFELMDDYGEPAHNDLLRLFVELGVLGALSYLALAAALVKRIWDSVRRDLGPLGNALSCAVFSAGAVFALASLTGNIFFRPALQWYLWALLGCLFNLGVLREEKKRE